MINQTNIQLQTDANRHLKQYKNNTQPYMIQAI